MDERPRWGIFPISICCLQRIWLSAEGAMMVLEAASLSHASLMDYW